MVKAGCFACFFGGVPSNNRDLGAFEDDEETDVLDAYMRKGVLRVDDTRGTLETSKHRLSQMGHTLNHGAGSARRSLVIPELVKDPIFTKFGHSDQQQRASGLDPAAREQLIVESEEAASQRTTPFASLTKGPLSGERQSSGQASERSTLRGSISGVQNSISNTPSMRSPAISNTPSLRDGQQALNKAWDTVMRNDVVAADTAVVAAEKPATRRSASARRPAQQPSKTIPRSKSVSKATESQPHSDSKQGSYIRSWLKAQEELVADAPQPPCSNHRNSKAPQPKVASKAPYRAAPKAANRTAQQDARRLPAMVREDSRETRSEVSGVAGVPPPLEKTMSQISVEADEMFPGRDEVQAQVRDLSREMQIRLCINDPDLLSRAQRHSSENEDRIFKAVCDDEDLFAAFRASV